MRGWSRLFALALCAVAWVPAMAEWQFVHDYDFTSGPPDPQAWSYETGFLRNQEAQYYRPENVSAQPGFLRIEARRETAMNAAWQAGARNWRRSRREAQYTSGSLVLREPLRYGRIEIVARSPGGAGVWPALWLVHEAPGAYGEIDFFEAVGKHPDTAFAAVHFGRDAARRRYRSSSRVLPGLEGSWHVHSVEWTPRRITVRLDGETLMEFDPAQAAAAGIDPLRGTMRLHINLALGGTWGGPIDDTRLPAHFDIRSVRVWRWQEGHDPAAADAAPAASAPADTAAAVPRWGR